MNSKPLLCGKRRKEMNVMHFNLVKKFVVELRVKCMDTTAFNYSWSYNSLSTNSFNPFV